ncbi:hypothetical protein G6F50_015506 [Rhizopus delemar]|uniref:Uncharacterized protein n=1 Tax=Rhizopus delemar TaxID=936053 RepID=A0A9P6XY02_9FUNG|nr:hypothetical protein G6F50_015506 [Rhizopus delemar]
MPQGTAAGRFRAHDALRSRGRCEFPPCAAVTNVRAAHSAGSQPAVPGQRRRSNGYGRHRVESASPVRSHRWPRPAWKGTQRVIHAAPAGGPPTACPRRRVAVAGSTSQVPAGVHAQWSA